MAGENKVNHWQQYEPPVKPESWTRTDEKHFYLRLIAALDDLYGRVRKITERDLAPDLKSWKDETGRDIASLAFGTEGLFAAVENNRLEFTQYGLVIKNAAGEAVFVQDTATGGLTIAGVLTALGGKIGGFTIGETSLSNGTSIVLDSEHGLVQLGNFTMHTALGACASLHPLFLEGVSIN